MTVITLESVTRSLARHAALYRRRRPIYQTVMLSSLARLWNGHHASLLDLGGGTGAMAQAIQELLPVDRVAAVDVVNRYFPTLSVETHVYDGAHLPFADGSFEAATINNVMHHVPIEIRANIMREMRRVVTGPIYIKDHVAVTWLDHYRLAALDAIGNIPFSGQIDADYLSQEQWERLAAEGGYRIAARIGGEYRTGPMAWLFPNRLETTMRFEPA